MRAPRFECKFPESQLHPGMACKLFRRKYYGKYLYCRTCQHIYERQPHLHHCVCCGMKLAMRGIAMKTEKKYIE